MLENSSDKISNPNDLKQQPRATEPKKSRKWLYQLIIILILLGIILYLFAHPQGIQNMVNNFFNNLLK